MSVIKRFNNAFGQVDDDPLSDTATTLNSAELPRLGVVDSINNEIARLTLDPERADGAPEIIHVTSYDGTATSATIERGKEGTTARQHALDTVWEHAPTVEDVNAGDVGSTSNSVAIFPTALAADSGCIAIGNLAEAGHGSFTNNNCIAIGGSAKAPGDGGISIGSSTSSESNGICIGQAASSVSNSVVIGKDASTSDGGCVAVGKFAVISVLNGTAIGTDTSVDHSGSTALGQGVATTASDQVKIGARHLALDEMTAPGAPPADEARLFCRDDGSGNTEIAAIFSSGEIKVIATGV